MIRSHTSINCMCLFFPGAATKEKRNRKKENGVSEQLAQATVWPEYQFFAYFFFLSVISFSLSFFPSLPCVAAPLGLTFRRAWE